MMHIAVVGLDARRGRALFFRVILGFVLAFGSASGGFAAEKQLSPREQEPVVLWSDEIYRRDGALAKIDTCLAVAEDKYIPSLLSHPSFDIPLDAPSDALVEKLRRSADELKLRRGFGTLLACAQIVSTWYSRTLAKDADGRLSARASVVSPSDGRLEHGAVVIDLSIGRDMRALIEPVPLARILTSPRLLPPSAYGGIVIRDAIINGTLLLHNLHLTNPLAFVNVTFAGRSYGKALFDNDRRIESTALAINYARFEDHLLFANSIFCGHVRVNDSQFHETVMFQKVSQQAIGCRRPPDLGKPMALFLNSSRFAQSLSMVQSRFGTTKVVGSDIKNLVASRTDFGSDLLVVENDIDSLQIQCSALAANAEISYNHVEKDLFVYGTDVSADCASWWQASGWLLNHKTAVEIASNRIGGGLGFQDFDAETLALEVSLMSNRVGNGSEVILPAPKDGAAWQGRINLEGSTYEGKIEIGVGGSDETKIKRDTGYCEQAHAAVIEFRAAKIRTLDWNLPLNCDYLWSGYGLSYDLWLAGPKALAGLSGRDKDQNQLAFETWRTTLSPRESASLDAMSRYLAGKGSYVDSRDILLEAKRLNYGPECVPDSNVFFCAWEVMFGDGNRSPGDDRSLITAGAVAQEQVGHPLLSDVHADGQVPLTERVWRTAMLGLLWPGGYGAKPERAILLTVGAAVAFWLLYLAYSLAMRHPLTDVPDAKPSSHRETSSMSRRAAAPGLDDLPPPKFDGMIDELAGIWPSHEVWAALTTEERLDMIQKTLLPKLRACEEQLDRAEPSTIRNLRRWLEAFGTTETLGFSQFDRNKMPTRFTHWRYSIDTMLPFVDLHAYSNYYPESGWIRALSVTQHVLGWWWLTVFIASAAIL